MVDLKDCFSRIKIFVSIASDKFLSLQRLQEEESEGILVKEGIDSQLR